MAQAFERQRADSAGARHMRRIAIALLVAVIVAFGFVPFQKIYDDGLWPLSVSIRSVAGRPIKGVSAQAFFDVENAREQMADLPPVAFTRVENSIYSAVQEPFEGRAVEVNVPTAETSFRSLLWTHRRFFQYRGLLVVVEYEGGKLEGRAIEIPDLRQGRHVAIDMP